MCVDGRRVRFHGLLEIFGVGQHRQQNHAVGPTFLKFLRLNMDILQRLEAEAVGRLLQLHGEGPHARIN